LVAADVVALMDLNHILLLLLVAVMVVVPLLTVLVTALGLLEQRGQAVAVAVALVAAPEQVAVEMVVLELLLSVTPKTMPHQQW
jgi:hypothetical protein